MTSEIHQAKNNTASTDTNNEPLPFLKNISNKETNCPKLPLNIQNILAINGFDNVIAFADITEYDLLHMQEFARSDLLEIVGENPGDRAKYYGIYQNTPEKFQFLPGIKRTIFIIRDVCESYVGLRENVYSSYNNKGSFEGCVEETPGKDLCKILHEESSKADSGKNTETTTSKYLDSEDDLHIFLRHYCSIPGDDITKLKITEFDIPTLSFADYPELASLMHLNVSYCNVRSISDDCFVNQTAVVDLYLMYNGMSQLSPNIFYNLSTLKELNLGNNKFERIPNGVFAQLKSLTHLNLESNKIVTIESSAFEGLESLKDLNLKENNLTILGDCLQSLTNLEVLNLKGNGIEVLEEAAFKGLSSLKELYLSDNQLSSMDENIFENNSSLTKLDLNNSKIKLIPKLSHLANLEILFLTRNNIRAIKNNNFASLTKLFTLKLDFNGIEEIEEGSFKDLESLYFLSFSVNKISKIHPDLFQNLVNLRILDLAFNNIRLEGSEFKNLKSLVSLNLDSNDFTTIKPNLLTHLEGLQFFSLTDLKLVRLESGIFSNMKNLRRLDLGENCFEFPEEPVGWLDGLDNLEMLSFECCTFKKLAKFSQKPLPSLKLLDLQHMNLSEIDPDFFDFYSSLKIVKVTSCDFPTDLIIQCMKAYPQIVFAL